MHNSECKCIHASVQLVDLHGQQVSFNLLIHHAFSMHANESFDVAFFSSGAVMLSCNILSFIMHNLN